MHPHSSDRRPPRRSLHPGLEPLEARDLPSTVPLSTLALHKPASGRAAIQTSGQRLATASSSVKPEARTPFPDPAVIANSINLLYGPNSASPMTPIPREVRRQTFVAKWVGTYTVGPPRFSDRASTINIYSKTGGSNQFHKGKLEMVLFPPADPNATPNPGDPYANQTTGIASLFTGNFLQTGGQMILDVNGAPGPGADPLALPTHLNWTFDSFASAGTYTAPALDFYQGVGVLDIRYLPDRHPLPGTMGSGRMIVAIQGLLNYSQLFSSVSPNIS
jgi:hypothetical protein